MAKIAAERSMVVVPDDAYDEIIHNPTKHYCLATLPGMRERMLIVNSFSKPTL